MQNNRSGLIESTGRKVGSAHGSYISDLAELCKTILLCYSCTRKFDHKKYRYYKQREFPYALGKCDACKAFGKNDLFLHESEVKKCWNITQKHNNSCRTDYSF